MQPRFIFSLYLNLCLAPLLWGQAEAEQHNHAMEIPGACYFTPPAGWQLAESSQLPANVKVMVVGKGDHVFAPSINLTVEPFKGTLKQYLKIVKNINDAKGSTWQDLGTIRTQAGNGNLSQVDIKTEWGESRMMHVILLKNQQVYILTAAALKDEFPRFYKEFFNALRSLHINKNNLELISNPKRRTDLQSSITQVQKEWSALINEHHELSLAAKEALFNQEAFQKHTWQPFLEKLTNQYKDMSPNWHQQIQVETKEELINLS